MSTNTKLAEWVEEAVEYVNSETRSPSLEREGRALLAAYDAEQVSQAKPAPAQAVPADAEQLRIAGLTLIGLAEHDQHCTVFDLDDDDKHCACSCGYEGAIAVITQAGKMAPAAPAPEAPKPHLFEFWWGRYMPNATQAEAWEAWQAAPCADGVGVIAPQAQAAGEDEREAFHAWHRAHGENTQGIRWVDALLWKCWQARAALALHQPLTEWQPIETAPKYELYRDGENRYARRILVWASGYDEPVRARWWWRTDFDACNFIADGGWAVFPTRWMPLPAAPGATTGEQNK